MIRASAAVLLCLTYARSVFGVNLRVGRHRSSRGLRGLNVRVAGSGYRSATKAERSRSKAMLTQSANLSAAFGPNAHARRRPRPKLRDPVEGIAGIPWHGSSGSPIGFSRPHFRRAGRPQLSVDVPTAVSLGAGSFAGAIGVGVAYPLDTLKTKLQAREKTAEEGKTENPVMLTLDLLREEGLGGFYGGVSSTMAGQAAIKGVVFAAFELAKDLFKRTALGESGAALLLSACISGAAASFVVTPVERVKCVMQASAVDAYDGPINCTRGLIRTDGVTGLLTRGLVATLLREIPAYAFYFVSYDIAKEFLTDGAVVGEALIPLIAGAVAGAMAWIPVYPIDVVKTNIQVRDGASGDEGFWGTAQGLWETGGLSAFWDGINPKLARAVVNHAVTFYIFELICSLYREYAQGAV